MQGSCSLAGDVRTAGLGWSASFQLLLFQPKSRKTMTVLKRVPYVQPFLFVLYSAPFKASGSAGVCNGLAGLSPYSGFSSFPLAPSPAFSPPVFARAAPSPGNEPPSPHLLCRMPASLPFPQQPEGYFSNTLTQRLHHPHTA